MQAAPTQLRLPLGKSNAPAAIAPAEVVEEVEMQEEEEEYFHVCN